MTNRRTKGPPSLSSGEKLLRSLLHHIGDGSITVASRAARKRLDDLAAAAREILNGKDPADALGLDDGSHLKSTFHRDYDMALFVNSELVHRRKPWPLVYRNIRGWLWSNAETRSVDPRYRSTAKR